VSRFDAIVVGAGHNGLTAAAYLARAGLHTLVLERRPIVGGCCVTEEIDPQQAPGCRVSTAAYMASMLRPEVIRDLGLGKRGLTMIPSEPGVQIALPDGRVLAWWADSERTAAELAPYSAHDAEHFVALETRLQDLASYLEPFFLEPPSIIESRGIERLAALWRIGRRFRRRRVSDVAELAAFMTTSIGRYLDTHFESDEAKRLLLANSLYGKHGGPYHPGTAAGLMFHLLTGGEDARQGYQGHVIGGMGAITQAMAQACVEFGVEIRTDSAVRKITQQDGNATGVELEDGDTMQAATVVSNADPKRTFLELVAETDLPADFRRSIANIKMDGPCGKVNLVLTEEPKVRGMPDNRTQEQRTLFTLVPTLAAAERCYQMAQNGEIAHDDLWVDCVVASNMDPGLASDGLHIMTCFVQYLPFRLSSGDWNSRREELGDCVVKKIGRYAPNVPGAVIARQVLSPWDLQQTFGITEGNIFHGDIAADQLFFQRPVLGWAGYRTPISGLYLCGAGTHPGGGVTGAPGYNAAHQVLRDLRRKQR
jgi:phytoene dehydrogenase-like protein